MLFFVRAVRLVTRIEKARLPKGQRANPLSHHLVDSLCDAWLVFVLATDHLPQRGLGGDT